MWCIAFCQQKAAKCAEITQRPFSTNLDGHYAGRYAAARLDRWIVDARESFLPVNDSQAGVGPRCRVYKAVMLIL